jgi:hypothetical protein
MVLHDGAPARMRPSLEFPLERSKGSAMEKWFCWGSLGIAAALLPFFILDMFLSIPFGGAGWMIDSFGAASCGVVAYLAWDSMRELR